MEKAMAPTPVLLPGKSHGQRSLVGCSPWGCKESDMTERLHFHFSLSCIGEGNGNPLQCSCLGNPRDNGAWWAAVYGVAQSWTPLKRLSSSNSSPSNVTLQLFLCPWMWAIFFFFFLPWVTVKPMGECLPIIHLRVTWLCFDSSFLRRQDAVSSANESPESPGLK